MGIWVFTQNYVNLDYCNKILHAFENIFLGRKSQAYHKNKYKMRIKTLCCLLQFVNLSHSHTFHHSIFTKIWWQARNHSPHFVKIESQKNWKIRFMARKREREGLIGRRIRIQTRFCYFQISLLSQKMFCFKNTLSAKDWESRIHPHLHGTTQRE